MLLLVPQASPPAVLVSGGVLAKVQVGTPAVPAAGFFFVLTVFDLVEVV